MHIRPNEQEQQLIDAIKAKPGFEVFPGRNGGCVLVARSSAKGVVQRSVWLGRANTMASLREIAADHAGHK